MSQLMMLSIEQQAAIDLLMTGLPDRDVADKVGVCRETVTRWRNYHPAFQAEVNRRRKEAWASGLERLRLLFPEAVDAMREVINDRENPQRWRAAVEILKVAGFPDSFLGRVGPCTPEDIVTDEAEMRKIKKRFEGLTEGPGREDIDEVLKELEKKVGEGSD